MLLLKDSGKLQILHHVIDSAGMPKMYFTPSKIKLPLQDLTGSKPNLGEEPLGEMERSGYSLSVRVPDEMSSRVQKTRLRFVNLRHLWRRRDIRL